MKLIEVPTVEYKYIPSVPTVILEAFIPVTVVPVPSAYTPIPPFPALISVVPAKITSESPLATIPIALLPVPESPTVILPDIVEAVPVAITPILSSPKVIVPAFIFEATPSRTNPVFPFPPVEVMLFAPSPPVAPLIYTPIPLSPVIVILLLFTAFPLAAAYIPIPSVPTSTVPVLFIFAISVYIPIDGV